MLPGAVDGAPLVSVTAWSVALVKPMERLVQSAEKLPLRFYFYRRGQYANSPNAAELPAMRAVPTPGTILCELRERTPQPSGPTGGGNPPLHPPVYGPVEVGDFWWYLYGWKKGKAKSAVLKVMLPSPAGARKVRHQRLEAYVSEDGGDDLGNLWWNGDWRKPTIRGKWGRGLGYRVKIKRGVLVVV